MVPNEILTPDDIGVEEERPLWMDALAEMSGTLVFVYISLSGVNQAVLTNQNQIHVAICFAIGLAAGIFVANKSGGHLNPAVSATVYAVDSKFTLRRLIAYVTAQLCGAFLGALLVVLVYHGWIESLKFKESFAGMFGTLRALETSLFSSILDQFIGSALLLVAIATVPSSSLKPAYLGCVLAALGLFQGSNGFAFNPARDLGPRIASTIVFGSTPFSARDYWFWVPIVIPFIGMAFGMAMVILASKLK